MTHNSHLIAQYAQLAMILEVCATPKPGNVDRDHNYPDTCFEHFLASAVSAYPVLKKASEEKKSIGLYIHKAVFESGKWQSGGNTHFGAFILLIPLVMAAGKLMDTMDSTPDMFPYLRKQTVDLIRSTTNEDAIELYRAFARTDVKVKEVSDLDVKDPTSIETMKIRGTTLYQLMEISSPYDMIAGEWTSGYRLTFNCAHDILKRHRSININDAVIWTFLSILAQNPDTFIQTKFDSNMAQLVSDRAKRITNIINEYGFEKAREDIRLFDEQLIKTKVNPGSTADIVIAGLFVALIGGLKI